MGQELVGVADEFDAQAYLDGVDELEKLGVTWLQVTVPGDSRQHLLETLARFGETVISKL